MKLSCVAMLKVNVHPLQLGGGVSAKELLAAREDAERRAEMAQSRAAGNSWSAPRPRTPPPSAPAAEKASNGGVNGASGGFSCFSGRLCVFQFGCRWIQSCITLKCGSCDLILLCMYRGAFLCLCLIRIICCASGCALSQQNG